MVRHGVVAIALLCGCLSTGPLLAAPPGKPKPPMRDAGASFDRTFEQEGQQEVERLCVEKMVKVLPLTSVPVSRLATGQLTVHIESGYYTVLLPLSQPQGDVRSLYWGADTIEEALTFIRLLQGGKIAQLRVEAYADELRRDADPRPGEAELRACSVERIKEFLTPCKDCFVVEWVFEGHIE